MYSLLMCRNFFCIIKKKYIFFLNYNFLAIFNVFLVTQQVYNSTTNCMFIPHSIVFLHIKWNMALTLRSMQDYMLINILLFAFSSFFCRPVAHQLRTTDLHIRLLWVLICLIQTVCIFVLKKNNKKVKMMI